MAKTVAFFLCIALCSCATADTGNNDDTFRRSNMFMTSSNSSSATPNVNPSPSPSPSPTPTSRSRPRRRSSLFTPGPSPNTEGNPAPKPTLISARVTGNATTSASSAVAGDLAKGGASTASAAAASTSKVVGGEADMCEYRCKRGVSCFVGTRQCDFQIFFAGIYWCNFFAMCPPGQGRLGPVYIPYPPPGLQG